MNLSFLEQEDEMIAYNPPPKNRTKIFTVVGFILATAILILFCA